jgi:hypothetical protein
MVGELREADLIVELPPTAGTTRRYVISNKGRADLEKLKGTVQKETKKQLEILAYYCELAGDKKVSSSIRDLVAKM